MGSVLFKSVNLKRAKVYKKTVSSTQSGRRDSEYWILKPLVDKSFRKDILMGWVGGSDIKNQIQLKFKSLNDLERYAKKNDIIIEINKSKERLKKIKSYAENFI